MISDRKITLVIGDIVMLALSFAAMVLIRFRASAQEELLGSQARMFLLLFLVWLVVFFIFDLYNLRRVNPNPRNIGLLALAVATSTLLSGVAFYLFSSDGITPKTNLALIAVFACVLLVGWRRLFYILFASRYRQKIALVGSGPAVDHLRADLAQHPHLGEVVSTHERFDAHTVFPSVHLVIADNINLETLMRITHLTGAEVLSLAHAYEELFGKIPLSLMTEERAIEILTHQSKGVYHFFGRIAECIIALLVLVIASPFLLIALLAILIEDGRPFFILQQRVGKNGIPFLLYKFRSMKALAPDGSAEVAGAQWAEKKDPRITKVGRILRSTHLDEVPQMINILKGDLALIGPRAERPEFVAALEQEIPYYFLRHAATPGFTGWAQIKFRYARTTDDSREKFEYDLYWLANRHPLLDLGIVAKTVQIIFTH